jgi:hypothetical protein
MIDDTSSDDEAIFFVSFFIALGEEYRVVFEVFNILTVHR